MARGAFMRQLWTLLKRNFLLKRRNKKQTIQELLMPIYFVAVLGAMKLGLQPSEQAAVEFPEQDLASSPSVDLQSKALFISPNNPTVEQFTDAVLDLLGVAPEDHQGKYRLFNSSTELEDAYRENNSAVAAGIDFQDGTLNSAAYTIRMDYKSIADSNKMYGDQGQCRDQHSENCPARTYITSGFISLQAAIETAFIQLKTGQPDFPVSNISIQQMPKPAFTAFSITMQVISAIYLVMAYSPFVSFLLVNLVTEKEKKIKEAMRMMGMRDLAFWLAWAVTYIIIIFLVTLICVAICALVRLMENSDMVLLYLILFAYGLSIITLSFAMTPLFDKATKAGALGGFITMVFSLLYLPISLTRTYGVDGPVSSIPVWGQFLLCLLSPVALALAVDQGMYLDAVHGGMGFHNITYGQFPVSYCLTMLFVDFVLYGLLALYLDSVVPAEYGQRQPAWFCFMPSYWCPQQSQIGNSDVHLCNRTTTSEDVEPISANLKDKDAIRISNIHKTFKGAKGEKQVTAVDGISLAMYEGQITCLLGHNGAGKTTLLNMLTGLSPPTAGSATIYGLSVSNANEMHQIRSMTGVCPQHNILFDVLTCAEHLWLYGELRGVPKSELGTEVDHALRDVDLLEQKDTFAGKLSGGQMRKLSVAIALIGDPRVIFLDEPTAGMDPYSRRQLWSLLKARRPGRVILLTTHFMDEADILADRKAFISKGRLKCVGSSLFLKNRFGIGYHLSMDLEPGTDLDQLTMLVRKDIQTAELSRSHNKEVIYVLPLAAVDSFPTLFENLEAIITDKDSAKKFGLINFGVSMTTLEEVFLKIGVEEGAEEEENIANGTESAVNPLLEADTQNAIAENQVSLSMDVKPDQSSLTWRRVGVLLWIGILTAKREMEIVFWRIVFPLILVTIGVAVAKFTQSTPTAGQPDELVLQPSIYCNMANDPDTQNNPSFVYFQNPGGPDADQYVTQLQNQEMSLLERNGSVEQLINHTQHIGNNIHNVEQGMVIDSNITALYNDTASHSLPIAVNIINSALFGMAVGGTDYITAISQPWPDLSGDLTGFDGSMFASVLLLGMAASGVANTFAVTAVITKQSKIRSQLRIFGITMNVYWGSQAIGDFLQYSIVSVGSIIIILAFQLPAFMYAGAILSTILIYLTYMPTMMLMAYNASFLFDNFETAQTVLPNLIIWVAMMPYFAVSFMDMFAATEAAKITHYICCALDPPYLIFGGLHYINRMYLVEYILQGPNPSIPLSKYFEWDGNISIVFMMPFFHCIWLYFLLRLVEVKANGGDYRDVLGYGAGLGSSSYVPENNNDVPDHEDADVVEERKRVDNWDPNGQRPVVMVKNLRKEFSKTAGCCSGCKKGQKDTKIAVRNNSFAVEAGEVFGLLGPNGAGKTTTLNLIIAEQGPTRGKVYVAGHDIRSNLSDAFQSMSFCPQHDALWPKITLREHIEAYASIAGVPKASISTIATYYMTSLKILEHADKQSHSLSGGTKRKLSYILSMLGEPEVVLMDEPSTGLDPTSKRFLWDTINRAFFGSQRGAILTTHYMEEADALCSRVGIMVNGQLECLGTTQHLKSKYGSSYILEVKLVHQPTVEATGHKMEALHSFVKDHFLNAEISECFGDRVSYNVPRECVESLAITFKTLEEGKTELGVEEYSFSQSTLEQVFLVFAKKQLDEGEKHDEEQSSGTEPSPPHVQSLNENMASHRDAYMV